MAYFVSASIDCRQTSFATGNARVVAMKHHTKPKLELMAVVTATTMKQMLVEEHECNFSGIFSWTNWIIVLQWIRNNYNEPPVFVANRVAETLDVITVDQWNHMEGGKTQPTWEHVASAIQNLRKI